MSFTYRQIKQSVEVMVFDFSIIFVNWYSFITLFFLILFSSFIIIPELSILIASYSSFALNMPDLIFIILLVFIASLIGDFITYFLAKRFSEKIKNYLQRFKWYTKNEAKTHKSLKEHEFSFVFFSRFMVAGASPVVNYLYGFEKLNQKKFILAVILGETVYSVGYPLIGYLFKDTWNELVNSVQYTILSIVLILFAIYVCYKILKFYKKRKKNNENLSKT